MKYIPLTSVLLALLLMLTVSAYATTADTGPTAEDIPEWALRPALEPDEEPAVDDTDTTEGETKQEYTTIYDTDGSILYTDDPALVDMVKATTLPQEETDPGLFLSKPFDEYTVTEGMLLLFLVLIGLLLGGLDHRNCSCRGVLMASVVAEFFQITGVDIVPPTTMAELIPYLLTVFVAVVLVTAVFRIVAAVAAALVNWRRF